MPIRDWSPTNAQTLKIHRIFRKFVPPPEWVGSMRVPSGRVSVFPPEHFSDDVSSFVEQMEQSTYAVVYHTGADGGYGVFQSPKGLRIGGPTKKREERLVFATGTDTASFIIKNASDPSGGIPVNTRGTMQGYITKTLPKPGDPDFGAYQPKDEDKRIYRYFLEQNFVLLYKKPKPQKYDYPVPDMAAVLIAPSHPPQTFLVMYDEFEEGYKRALYSEKIQYPEIFMSFVSIVPGASQHPTIEDILLPNAPKNATLHILMIDF